MPRFPSNDQVKFLDAGFRKHTKQDKEESKITCGGLVSVFPSTFLVAQTLLFISKSCRQVQLMLSIPLEWSGETLAVKSSQSTAALNGA